MRLPNFLVVGAAKSGTTALYHFLKQHPQVYMSPHKETNYFAFEGQEIRFSGPGDDTISEQSITTAEAYEKQFEGVSGEVAVGEASPWYLYSERAAENIRCSLPDARLIAILRNPVDRAFSSYLHVVRDGRESLTFEEGLKAEEERISKGWEYIWHYRQSGYYAAQVERFATLFPPDQARWYLYEEFLTDPDKLVRDVCGFLNIDRDFSVNTSFKPNATGVPKNQLLGRLLLRPNPIKSTAKHLIPKRLRYNLGQRVNQRLLTKPRMSGETRRKLLHAYKDDISDLQDLIGRDLSAWRLSA